MLSCEGCEYLGFERFRSGYTAARCFAPLAPPWGNGRVIGNPTPRLLPEKIERPKWCERRTENEKQYKTFILYEVLA